MEDELLESELVDKIELLLEVVLGSGGFKAPVANIRYTPTPRRTRTKAMPPYALPCSTKLHYLLGLLSAYANKTIALTGISTSRAIVRDIGAGGGGGLHPEVHTTCCAFR